MEEQVVSVEDIEEDNLLVKVSRKLGTIPISFFYVGNLPAMPVVT